MLAESESTMHVPGGDFDTSTISKALADFESALSVAETKLISAGTNKIRANVTGSLCCLFEVLVKFLVDDGADNATPMDSSVCEEGLSLAEQICLRSACLPESDPGHALGLSAGSFAKTAFELGLVV